jgi:hypothetical protein
MGQEVSLIGEDIFNSTPQLPQAMVLECDDKKTLKRFVDKTHKVRDQLRFISKAECNGREEGTRETLLTRRGWELRGTTGSPLSRNIYTR